MRTVLVHDPVEAHVRSPDNQPAWRVARFLPGATLALLGTLAALGGGGVLAAFGTDNTLTSGPHLASTQAAAVVSSVANIKNTSGVATITGQPTVRISASPVQGTTGAFVGIGRTADVDRYLAGVTTETVSSLSSDQSSISGVSHGSRGNAQSPTAQRFWVAEATSTRTAQVNWKVRDGKYRVVIMSANGHGGFATTSEVGVTLPHIARYALVAILLGLLIAAGGTALVIRATRRSQNESNTGSSKEQR
jgi:hypothetical protein